MIKNLLASLVLVAVTGVALAQTGSAPPTAGTPPPAGAPTAAGGPAPPDGVPPVSPPTETPSPGDARKLCTAAMNADPQFAAEIVKIADERAQQKRDADTVAAHVDANSHVQKNQRHVIYAYAGMWLLAAGFVVFLWRRQQVLQVEITNLRRDLEAAGEPSPKART